MPFRPLLIAAALALTTHPAVAQPVVSVETALEIRLGLTGDAEKRAITYDCEGLEPMSVQYINAAPNFLALVPVNGETLVLAAVLSGSGVRYAAANWVWWTSGAEASLYDLTLGDEADPIATCLEFTMTP